MFKVSFEELKWWRFTNGIWQFIPFIGLASANAWFPNLPSDRITTKSAWDEGYRAHLD